MTINICNDKMQSGINYSVLVLIKKRVILIIIPMLILLI